MPTYNSDQITQNVPGPYHGIGGDVQRIRFNVSLTAAVTTADVINFGRVPAGFRLHGAILKASDIDTNGAPAVTINVGDAGDVDRIFAVSTVGQTGTYTDVPAATAMFYKWDAETMITGAIAVNPATGVAGTLELMLIGVFEATVLT